MTVRTHPKMIWQGKPLWNPSSWSWVTIGATASAEGIEKRGRLITARQFSRKTGGAAIELLVGFEGAHYSAVIQLDDPESIPALHKKLEPLRGFSLQEIGNLELDLERKRQKAPLPRASQ